MSENVLIAIINGSFLLGAVIFPVALAGIISWRYCKTKKELQRYYTALLDLEYMIQLEHEHCRIHKEESGHSHRRFARKVVNANHAWSFRNSPSRIKLEKERIAKRLNIIDQRTAQLEVTHK